MILKEGMMNTHDEHYKPTFYFSTSYFLDNVVRYPRMLRNINILNVLTRQQYIAHVKYACSFIWYNL